MNHLIAHPDDYTGAFKVLSQNLQKMFLHAYQSYIFNIILSRRISSGLSIHEAYDGDIVCFKNEMGLPDASRLQKVTKDNLDGINNLINRGRAFATAPLVGYETQFAEGAPGEIERAVVRELNIDMEGFNSDLLIASTACLTPAASSPNLFCVVGCWLPSTKAASCPATG